MSTLNDNVEYESLAKNSLRDEVTKHLLMKIFRRQLPAGTRLVIQKLATSFGVSTTPVREALVVLESVGLVSSSYNQGVVVRPFGIDQLREICQIRRILETEATRCACGQVDSDYLIKLRRETLKLAESPETEERCQKALALDTAIHAAIHSKCNSVRLAEEIERSAMLVNTIAEIAGNRHAVQARAFSEHVSIIDELLAGNAEIAAEKMACHISNTARDLAAIMFSDEVVD